MESSVDFGELSHDEDLKSRVTDFATNLKGVEQMLKTFCSLNVYNELTKEDKVRYDLFLAFSINTLYWFYLRTLGVDPNQHNIRSELNRIREYMAKSKKIYERKNIMPRLDQEAAKRFIRSGLWAPNTSSASNKDASEGQMVSRKRKRESDDED